MATTEILQGAPSTTGLRICDAWRHSGVATRAALPIAVAVLTCTIAVVAAPAVVKVGLSASGVFLTLAALVDSWERRLPNPLLAAAASSGLAGALSTGRIAPLLGSVAGLVLGTGLLLGVRLVRGVGMGDVKMAGAMGAGLGVISITGVALAVAIGAFAASSFALSTRRTTLPLGPSLVLGWWAALLATCGVPG